MKKPNCPDCGHPFARNGFTGSGRKRRYICLKRTGGCGYSTTDPAAPSRRKQDGTATEKRRPPVFKRSLAGVKRFIVTAAQNATPVHKGFLKNLELAANAKNAELIVVPIRYKNPTSKWAASQANEEYWDEAVQPYLYNTRRNLNKNLVLLGDIKTQPTASSPLSGFEAITHGESGILAHTKLQLKTIAAPQSKMPKILTTTGAVTVPNYTDTKTGKLGEFHHAQAAVMVEISGGIFHMRQLNATSDGRFQDLDTVYGADWTKNGIARGIPIEALAMGDTHVDFIDPDVEKATFGDGGMVALLKPRHLIWHDLLDGHTVNPHHHGNPFMSIAKVKNNRADAREEVIRALEFLDRYTKNGVKSVVVASNHDDFLSRWIISQDWRTAPGNAEFYLETALAMVRGTKFEPHGVTHPSPFAYWGRKFFEGNKNVRFLDADEDFTLCGVKLDMHGDRGPNGVRGSRHNLRRIGVKSIVNHSHSPGIEEGCTQGGTSTRLRAEYTSGPSSWMNTHVILYGNSKRSLANIIGGEWRL